jgi:hypothetical protein
VGCGFFSRVFTGFSWFFHAIFTRKCGGFRGLWKIGMFFYFFEQIEQRSNQETKGTAAESQTGKMRAWMGRMRRMGRRRLVLPKEGRVWAQQELRPTIIEFSEGP